MNWYYSTGKCETNFYYELIKAVRERNLDELKRLFKKLSEVVPEETIKRFDILHEADNISIIQFLISQGVNVNAKDLRGFTPLMNALEKDLPKNIVYELLKNNADLCFGRLLILAKRVEIAKTLIDYGLDISNTEMYEYSILGDALQEHVGEELFCFLVASGAEPNSFVNGTNCTPLHVCAKLGYEEAVKMLIVHKAELNAINKLGVTPLFYATQFEFVSIVKQLLQAGANPNVYNVLHIAAYIGNTELVTLLIKYGANLNTENRKNETPLMSAICNKHVDIVKQLLDIDIDHKYMSEPKTLLYAVRSNNNVILKLLLDSGFNINGESGSQSLIIAFQSRNEEAIDLLINRGVDVSFHDGSNGYNALHYAVNYGCHLRISSLVRRGVDINAKDNNGKTPLMHAILNNQNDVVIELLKEGADLKLTTNRGSTVLHLTVCTANFQLTKLLLTLTDATTKDEDGETPLDTACNLYSNHLTDDGVEVTDRTNIIYTLVEHKGNSTCTTFTSNSPLHYAAISGDDNLTMLMVNLGCDVNRMNKNIHTPLILAFQKVYAEFCYNQLQINTSEEGPWINYLNVIKTLLKHGANPNITNSSFNMYNPLHYAVRFRNKELIKVLIVLGCDGNARDYENMSPLENFLTYNILPRAIESIEIVILLLGSISGIDSDLKSKLLQFAMNFKWLEVDNKDGLNVWLNLIEILLMNRIDINAVVPFHNETLIQNAISDNNEKLVELFIRHNANMNVEGQNGLPLLAHACKCGRTNICQKLLLAGGDINWKHPSSGETLLHYAVLSKDEYLCSLLVEYGIDINAEDISVGTPLILACRRWYVQIIHVLINLGADPNCHNLTKTPFHPIHFATLHNNLEITEALISREADLNIFHDTTLSPLMIALLQHGHYSLTIACELDIFELPEFVYRSRTGSNNSNRLIELLVNRGCDLNAKTSTGLTALFCSIATDNKQWTKVLLEKGADVHCKVSSTNDSVLHFNITEEMMELLILHGADINAQNGNGVTPLISVLSKGPVSTAFYKKMIEHGAKVNLKENCIRPLIFTIDDENLYLVEKANLELDVNVRCLKNINLIPLHEAVLENKIKLISYLLDKHVDVSCKDLSGRIALHYADFQSLPELLIAQRLISHGFVNSRDVNKNTPLHCAARHGSRDFVELLLSNGADVNAKNDEGITPIHLCLTNIDCVYLLSSFISFGANINSKDHNGRSPLHMLFHNNFKSSEKILETLKILLNNGADVNCKDDNGMTVFDHMINSQIRRPCNRICFEKVFNTIQGFGFDVNYKNRDGLTPLMCICKRRQFSDVVIEVLLKSGADPNIKDNNERNALHWLIANSCRSDYLLQLLLTFEVDVTAEDSEKNTPLQMLCNKISREPNNNYHSTFVFELIKYNLLYDIDIWTKCEVSLTNYKYLVDLSIEVNCFIRELEILKDAYFTYPQLKLHQYDKTTNRETVTDIWVMYHNSDLKELKKQHHLSTVPVLDILTEKDKTKLASRLQYNNIPEIMNYLKTSVHCKNYHNIIIRKLEAVTKGNILLFRKRQLSCFKRLRVQSSNTINGKIVILNTYCLFDLAKYLSNVDMTRFILASLPP